LGDDLGKSLNNAHMLKMSGAISPFARLAVHPG
jgi:hypothetical protein